MELGPESMKVVVMIKFQLPDCFNGSRRRMQMRVMVDSRAIYFVNILV
jgi:hypothetical protein